MSRPPVLDRGPLPRLLAAAVARLLALEPSLEAVVLCGSWARGEQDRFSDLDLLALTGQSPSRDELAWLEPDPELGPIHVSVGVQSVADFEDEADGASASWSLGFPARDVMWRFDVGSSGQLSRPTDVSEHLPAVPPAFGDFVELWMKVRRATAQGDGLALRWAARLLAETSVGLMRPHNPPVEVASPVEALRAALAFEQAPPGYAEDFRACCGLVGVTDAEVAAAARRLQEGVIGWLRARDGAGDASLELGARTGEGALRAYLDG